ncbi:MAG TPA: small, acid-soluble spore protein, alpha/beta type [Limnochordales bacterium]
MQGADLAGAGRDTTESLKEEIAEDLGLADDLGNPDQLTVREAGKIGGQMVRRLVEAGKETLARDRRRGRHADDRA